MPRSLQNGPHLLNANTITDVVEQERLGVYSQGYFKPGDKDMAVLRTGRSDTDLRSRLLRYVQNVEDAWDARGCSYFYIEYTSSIEETYRLECQLFHDFRPPNNSDHPPRPKDWPKTKRLTCPVAGCRYSKWPPLDD